jgi:hypothetical protein
MNEKISAAFSRRSIDGNSISEIAPFPFVLLKESVIVPDVPLYKSEYRNPQFSSRCIFCIYDRFIGRSNVCASETATDNEDEEVAISNFANATFVCVKIGMIKNVPTIAEARIKAHSGYKGVERISHFRKVVTGRTKKDARYRHDVLGFGLIEKR